MWLAAVVGYLLTPVRDASEPPCAKGAAAVPGRGAQRRSSAAVEGAAGGAAGGWDPVNFVGDLHHSGTI